MLCFSNGKALIFGSLRELDASLAVGQHKEQCWTKRATAKRSCGLARMIVCVVRHDLALVPVETYLVSRGSISEGYDHSREEKVAL